MGNDRFEKMNKKHKRLDVTAFVNNQVTIAPPKLGVYRRTLKLLPQGEN
jgi:hypothetical protein